MSAKLTAKELQAFKFANLGRATEDRRLTDKDVRLLSWLAVVACVRNTGIARKSQVVMAKAIGAERRFVQISLNRLVACGYLVPTPGIGRGRIRPYFLCRDSNAGWYLSSGDVHAGAHLSGETDDGDVHPDAHVDVHPDAHPLPETAKATAGSPSSADQRTRVQGDVHPDAQTCAPPCAHLPCNTLISSLSDDRETEPGGPRQREAALGPLDDNFAAWVCKARFVSQTEDGTLTLSAPTKFLANQIANRFERPILESAPGATRLVIAVAAAKAEEGGGR
jgi:hypothetical protein